MNFKSYLQTAALEINQELDNFFGVWNGEVKEISPKLYSLSKSFADACEGGKRIRGALVKLGYEISANRLPTIPILEDPRRMEFVGTDFRGRQKTEDGRHEILKPAAAFEIFQTAILAHDDIIDQSPLRRGKPTLYHVLGGNQYGISQTICLGDIGYFLAVRLIAQSNFPSDRKNQALSLFAQAMLETALGQMLDVELPYQKELVVEADALTVFRLKTARYTISGPLSLGAILGGADDKLLDGLNKFGEILGVAFQIQDDILGVFGDEKTLGKSVTSDIEEGKLTLLILQALKKASAKQNQILKEYYGKGKIGEKELEQIRQIFISIGSLEYSQKKAEKLVLEAKNMIPLLTKNYELKTILEEMADYLVRRVK